MCRLCFLGRFLPCPQPSPTVAAYKGGASANVGTGATRAQPLAQARFEIRLLFQATSWKACTRRLRRGVHVIDFATRQFG